MNKNILSVGELTGLIKSVLEQDFSSVLVEGEISNFKRHSSGHRYFSLKDNYAQISCTLWKQRNIDFVPENGMKVIISGRITVYPPRGNYQIDVFSIKPAGLGDLYLAFEALKKKLEENGLFNPENKKQIPDLPLKIGVATSPTGAAIRDILSTLERRMPAAKIYLRPTIVQGDNSGEDISKAITELDSVKPDLIIIGRGGGSIEDLWGFNTEITAYAIFNAKTPIISAVGHETDFTIADFVSDVRAATPTAGAEIASKITLDNIFEYLKINSKRMNSFLIEKVHKLFEDIDVFSKRNIRQKIIDKINYYNQRNDETIYRIKKEINYNLRKYSDKINSLNSHLSSLNPEAPFEKGYALLKTNGEIIDNELSLSKIKKIQIIRKDEEAEAKIIKILPKSLF